MVLRHHFSPPPANTTSRPLPWGILQVARLIKGPLPALMHCAPRTQIPRISCYTKLLIVVKSFPKDLVIVRTTQSVRLKKIVIHSNGKGYLLEENSHPFQRLNYLFKKFVSRSTVPNHFHPSRFSTNLSKKVSLNNSS